jgi:hypothetical protein
MPQQADSEQAGIAAGLQNRVQQSAAIAAMRDNEEHPPSAPASSPYASTPQDKVAHQHPAPKGEKATYQQAQDILKKTLTPKVYDKGGKVNVNPNDGKHEVAILKDGERVLTPEQNKDWEHAKDLGGVSGKAPTTLPIGGKTVRDSNDVTPDMTPKKVYDKGGVVGDKDNYHHEDYSPTEKSEFHRSMSSLHTGGLHRALGIPEGEKIPLSKIEAATHSDNGHLKKMAVMARSMHSWKHGKK